MTFWTWIFLALLFISLVPISWLVSHAVGMEKASWGRALLFSIFETAAAMVAMRLIPFHFFILEAIAGIFAVLFLSPIAFRVLMTQENARALLGSLLLTVISIGGVVLLVVL